MKKSSVWKRRQLVVSTRFQWPIVLKILAFTCLIVFFLAWSLFYLFWQSSLQSHNSALLESFYQREFWLSYALCLLICLAVSALVLLKTTHRVAGQMYRFEKTLDQVLAGENPGPILTRKSDYFHEFETELNAWLASRREK